MKRSRRAAIVSRLRPVALVAAIAAVPFVAGCGLGGAPDQADLGTNPAFVVRVLPTRPGLEIAGPETATGPGEFDRATLGTSVPALAASARDGGLRAAATRRWTGPDGAGLVAVASLWDDNEPARSIGGQVAREAVPDGTPWTPSQYPGSQGYRSATARALNVVTGNTALLVIARGPVDDAAVLRTVELMQKASNREDTQGAVDGG